MDRYMKKDADFILTQLELHSPIWTKLLRRYIRYLERKSRKKPEGNK